jgi:hypothetical protein
MASLLDQLHGAFGTEFRCPIREEIGTNNYDQYHDKHDRRHVLGDKGLEIDVHVRKFNIE